MQLDPQQIKTLRIEQGLSQELLAERAGLSVRTVQRIEASGTVSAQTLLALTSALDTTPSALGVSSGDIQVASSWRLLLRNLGAFLLVAAAMVFFMWIADDLPVFVDVPSVLFLLLIYVGMTVLSAGLAGLKESVKGLRMLLVGRVVPSEQARQLANLYGHQIVVMYAAAMIGVLIGAVAIYFNIDSSESMAFSRAWGVNLLVLLYAGLFVELVLRPLRFKLLNPM